MLLTTPRKPRTVTAGIVSRTRLKIGTPSMTAPSNRNDTPAARASSVERAIREGDRPLVGGDDVRAGGEARADVRNRRLARFHVERRRFDQHAGGARRHSRERIGDESDGRLDIGPGQLVPASCARRRGRRHRRATVVPRRDADDHGSMPERRNAARDSSSSVTNRRATLP